MSTHDAVVTAALAQARRDTGVAWTLVERMPGGLQGGAWRVSAPDGRIAVVKVTTRTGWAAQVLRADAAVAAARRAGYPTPAWIAVGRTDGGGAYHLEEFVAGHAVEHVDLGRARTLTALLEAQRGIDPDPGRCWTDHLRAPVGAIDGAVAATGTAGRHLVAVCAALQEGADAAAWPRDDLVHGDFRPANVLFDGAAAAGVVDVEALGSGPRALDYATLLSHERVDDDAVSTLVAAGAASAPPAVFRACVAHAFLDLVRFVAALPGATDASVAEVAEHLSARATIIDRRAPA